MNEIGKVIATLGVCVVAGLAIWLGHPVLTFLVMFFGLSLLWDD